MSDRNDASALRRRAAELRRFAARVHSSPALLLDRGADIDTWRGPRALDCANEFAAARQLVLHSADDLHQRSRQLERMADELDALPVAPGMSIGHPGGMW